MSWYDAFGFVHSSNSKMESRGLSKVLWTHQLNPESSFPHILSQMSPQDSRLSLLLSEHRCSYPDHFCVPACATFPCPLSTTLKDETTLGSLCFWSWVVMTTSLFWSIAFNMEGKLWLHGLVIRLVSILFYLVLPALLGVGKLRHTAQTHWLFM